MKLSWLEDLLEFLKLSIFSNSSLTEKNLIDQSIPMKLLLMVLQFRLLFSVVMVLIQLILFF